MKKINLVIADEDSDYVGSLVDYLMFYHARKFSVTSFTEEAQLKEYLEDRASQPEILLVGGTFYEKLGDLLQARHSLIIFLTSEKIKSEKKETGQVKGRSINKYQYGDKIVTEILQIFAEETSLSYAFPPACQKTKIMGVYSPIGGVGKTTLAIGASIQSAWEGKSCFYLNLENMASTSLYFTGEQEENISSILYFLKNNRRNLSLHLEKAKCVDPVYKIAYYHPPDSILDFNEDLTEELSILLKELRATSQYERIFVDMSSEINRNNLAVLRACDELILVAEQKMSAVTKIKGMFKELRLLGSREGWDISDKFHLVLNKERAVGNLSEEAINYEEELRPHSKGVLARIPMVEDLAMWQDGVYKLDMNTGFGKAIHELLAHF